MTGKDGRRLGEMADELDEMSTQYEHGSLTAEDLMKCAVALRTARAGKKFSVAVPLPWLHQIRPHI